jgi:hypothetical protein
MLPTIDMSEPMQEAIPAFVVGSDLAHWSCCTTLPMTSAAPTDAFLSFSGAPFFVVNMSTSCFRRYEDTMRESANSSTQHQRYHVLSAATLSNGDSRNFVHMKVMWRPERHGLFCARPFQAGVRVPQRPDQHTSVQVHYEHFSRTADRPVKRPKIDLELLDRSCVDGSVGAWVGNGLKTR